jgi:hypothetical protein
MFGPRTADIGDSVEYYSESHQYVVLLTERRTLWSVGVCVFAHKFERAYPNLFLACARLSAQVGKVGYQPLSRARSTPMALWT